MRQRPLGVTVAMVAASAVAIVGCGNDAKSSKTTTEAKRDTSTTMTSTSPTGSTAATQSTASSADDASSKALALEVKSGQFRFDHDSLSTKAGSVTITLDNTESIQHNIALKSSSGDVISEGKLVGAGEQSTITVDLKPGTYEYYCTPHETVGMKGTLTVT
ncbi:MAG: hypothetical protein JWN41_726 [Thermoleophilia bacterium]|nr:hypothetical protein [Thermoleophilia bacterium]